MKKILLILCLALTLTGCKTIADIKPDTIVDIPLHPTEAATEPATEPTEVPTETEPVQTEPPGPAETQKPDNTASGGKTNNSKPSGGQGSESTKPQATEPPTQPPTDPPAEPPTQSPTEAPTAPPTYDPTGYAPCSLDYAAADAVNALRQEAGLEPLVMDARLCAIASVRAYELSLEWNYRRPDGSAGVTVLSQYGYSYGWAAENLYNGVRSGEKIASRWMNSESSAGNMLSESARVIGVGSYVAADGMTYLAAIFVG